MTKHYAHLGIFSDWVDAARAQQPLFPLAQPGAETQRKLRHALGFCHLPEQALDVQIESRWQRDGVAGELLSYSVGFGPRTQAYLLKPVGVTRPLPGILALHDHGGYKFYGKEKIADGPEGEAPGLRAHRQRAYGNRAFANALAREGFAVLVNDVFLWGSRGFPLETMQAGIGDSPIDDSRYAEQPAEIAHYNALAFAHEHFAAKYCNLLGTNLAGVVAYEDRVALNYLLSRADVRPDWAGCVGLSGGGNRAVLLQGTFDRLRACVVVGLMCTYEGLLDHNMSHTWMLFPSLWSREGDWPDIAACRAPSPLLVQYDLEDQLFTLEGMQAAHARLQAHYAGVGQPGAYTGQFYPGPHKFDLQMQAAAFDWLKRQAGVLK